MIRLNLDSSTPEKAGRLSKADSEKPVKVQKPRSKGKKAKAKGGTPKGQEPSPDAGNAGEQP